MVEFKNSPWDTIKNTDDRNGAIITHYTRRYDKLSESKTNYLPIYEELAILGDPRNAYFRVQRTPGDLSQLIAKTDDTLQSNLSLHAAVMNSLLTPAAYMWHKLRFVNDDAQMRFGADLEKQNQVLYKKRYSAHSNFMSAINTTYMNNALYGWYVLELTKDMKKKQVTYRALPITEFVIAQNERGFIDTFYRKVKFTYRQLRQIFPNYTPKTVLESQDMQDNPYAWLDKDVTMLHVVEPSLEHANKYDSIYLDLDSKEVIERTLEKHCKYIAGRAATFANSNDPYGLSPVMTVFPSAKNLNAISFDLIKVAHIATRYDVLAGEDVVNPRKFPDATSVINGGIDSEGRAQVSVLDNRAMPVVDYMIDIWRKRIKDALFVDLFSSLQETQSRSATDAMLKANERANIIAPLGDRLCRELLVPLIELEIAYYSEMGELPDFPKEAAGQEFDIELDNPMLRGQRLDSANGIVNMAASLGNIKQMDDEFNVDRTKMYMAEAYNVPLTIFNTPEEKQQIVEARQEQMENQMLAENAGNLGNAMEKFNNIANQNPQQ